MPEITRAKIEDAEEILEYCKIIGAESDNMTYDGRGLMISLEEERNYLKQMQDSKTQVFLVAREGGKIVGTCNYSGYKKERLAHRGEFGISVRKSHWGKGIGTKLMQEMIKIAKNEFHAEIISLEVRSDNHAAIGLYKKFGFRKIGKWEGFMKIKEEWIDFDIMVLHI